MLLFTNAADALTIGKGDTDGRSIGERASFGIELYPAADGLKYLWL